MYASRPVVHPVLAPPFELAAQPPPNVRTRAVKGSAGTPVSLVLRCLQCIFALAAIILMISNTEYSTVPAFCIFVAAMILQCLWSLLSAFIDIYAILVKRCLRNSRVASVIAIGDMIITVLTAIAANASAGVTVLLKSDISLCRRIKCAHYETAVAMGFICWFLVSPSLLFNFLSLMSRYNN